MTGSLFRFWKKTQKSEPPRFRTIKLYSIAQDQARIDRPLLVESVLSVFSRCFKTLPRDFDIHGPYGVRKGTSVGIKAFRSKLEKKGHEKYYALNGYTAGLLGFELLLEATCAADTTYSELVIWYSLQDFDVPFLDIAISLLQPLGATSGYEIDLPDNILHVPSENRIRKTLGGIAVTISTEPRRWVPGAMQGAVRDVFRNNIVNNAQKKHLESAGIIGSRLPGHDLTFIGFDDDLALQQAKSRFEELNAIR